ncbi:MAG: YggT family protein [bacterium]
MAHLLANLIDIYMAVVIIRVILSWFSVDASNPFVKFLVDITEPVLSKIRGVIPSIGGLDLSPLILILALSFLRNLIY